MSSWRAAWIVFMKELVDALRDRRTLAAVLLSSVAVGPLVLAMISVLVDKVQRQADAREIVAVGMAHAPGLRNYLLRQTWHVREAPADWQGRLAAGKLGDPVLVVPDDFEETLSHGIAPRLELASSGTDARSQSALPRVQAVLQGYAHEQATLRLVARGVAPSLLQVLDIDPHDLADPAARAAQITGMLPFFVLMAVVYGALHAALDTTAGERERGSLEPLLATPAPRPALVAGKWGAVTAVGLLVAVLSCLSFFPGQWLLRSDSLAALFRFGWREALDFILLLAPLAAALSALMMAVAIRSRTIKEAQASNVGLVLVISLLPLASLLNDEGELGWHFWIPGLAQTTLMTRVLKNAAISAADVLPGLAVCAVVTLLALTYVGRELARRAVR